MKKIVIIGALGYIGTELSRIYSGESWKNKIIALDSRFVSERVNQLNSWGIQFFQGHILDKIFLKKHLFDADVVHHLAGVTDVAYTKSEANSELDKKITTIGVNGTNNILEAIPNNCKIIFPSTHVVFEGLNVQKKNLKEDDNTSAILSYAKSKIQNEKDIIKSGKRYIILRLGSVYGYSLDTMRINIMPNLFSKMTSQEQNIKLFGGGKQLKSLVNIIDVVRCMKFFEENNKFKNQLYHLVNEQKTVKQVAEICKKINPKIQLENTDDEVPNAGYTLSNKKILKTGFKFLYNLEESISEMFNKWKFEKDKKNLEYVFRGENEFHDHRGTISNFELPEPVNLIGYIDSKKNTVRANHYHPVQEQKCLLIKGQFISVYKDIKSERTPLITHVVNEKEVIVTKPNVAHAMIFTKDSVFLNLVRGEREHENYGITHTYPYVLVDDKNKKNILRYYKFDCRSCGNTKLKRVISLGMQPLANNLLSKKNQIFEKYPLEVNYCPQCHNCQLSVSVDEKKMFDNYLYLSSVSNSLKKHFSDAAHKYIDDLRLTKKSFIVDIGSNDGVGLKPFKDLGFKNLLGIEPAKNLAKLANKNGIKTYNEYLTDRTVKKIKKKADLITASNVFAHADNLKAMAKSMLNLLSKNGSIVIEVQYILNTLKDLTFDNIYHEHFNYWSVTSLKYFFDNLKVKIYKVEKIESHGGSIRVFIKKNKSVKIHKSVKNFLKEEEKFGIKKFETYANFEKKINIIKENVNRNINELRKKNKYLVGYGAPAKATTALNFFGISKEIDFIAEDNELKKNKYIPGVNIKIGSKKKINKASTVIVFAWNVFTDIKNKNKNLAKKFISIKDLEK